MGSLKTHRFGVRASREPWQVEEFKKLSADQSLRVFEVATPAEKRQLAPYLQRKEKEQTRQFQSKALAALRSVTQ